MKYRYTVCVSLFLSLLLAGCQPPRPYDRIIRTPDDQHVFVMLVPDEWGGHRNTDIRRQFPQPGLYAIAHPDTPLWTVTGWFNQIVLTSDVHQMAGLVYPEYTPTDDSAPSITLFTSGRLVSQQQLPNLCSPCEGKVAIRFDEPAGRLIVESGSIHLRRYTFDSTTGTLLEHTVTETEAFTQWRADNNRLILRIGLICLAVLATSFGVLFLIGLQGDKKRKTPS